MKILVAVANYYPTDKVYSSFFVRGRNIYYKEQGLDVSILNFAAKEDCYVDGIPTYTLLTLKKKLKSEKFDILVCHAPNVRNHYLFLKLYGKHFSKIVFFFHGHEVLKISEVYSEPYGYMKQRDFHKRFARDVYDKIKLSIWHNFFPKIAYKSHFVFVSRWMYDEFLKWTRISSEVIKDRMSITYNSVSKFFEEGVYEKSDSPKYDFITIRANLDGSKYCIDLVVALANRYPDYKFCIVGKGQFFNFTQKPDNVTWVNEHLDHKQIVSLLNSSSCALMPTRTDAQGLMACEMATFGIPLITSDIPVCHEIFDDFENVALISNEYYGDNFIELYNRLVASVPYKKNPIYFSENTCKHEIEIFRGM